MPYVADTHDTQLVVTKTTIPDADIKHAMPYRVVKYQCTVNIPPRWYTASQSS